MGRTGKGGFSIDLRKRQRRRPKRDTEPKPNLTLDQAISILQAHDWKLMKYVRELLEKSDGPRVEEALRDQKIVVFQMWSWCLLHC